MLDKTAAVLNALESGPASLAQLVTATGLARPTAHRIAVALERHRLLARDSQGRFILGPRIAELATAAGEDRLLAVAQPVLVTLRDLTGESAQLYRRQADSRICVAAAERATGLRDTVPVGSALPMTPGRPRRSCWPGRSRNGCTAGCAGRSSPPPRWPRCAGAAGRPAWPSARPGWPRCPHRSAARAGRSSRPSQYPGRSSGSPGRRAGCTPTPWSPRATGSPAPSAAPADG